MAASRLRSALRITQLVGLAARNVTRNTTRSMLSLAAIAAGVAGLILSGGFIDDLIFQLGEAVIHSQSGHVQVGRSGYFASGSRSPGRYLVSPDEMARLAPEKLPHVAQVMRRVGFSGLLGNGRSSYPIVGEGIEPDKEAKLGTYMVLAEGRALTSRDRYGALVGAGVAHAMGLKAGSSFSVVAPTIDEAMNTVDLEVVGIFHSFSRITTTGPSRSRSKRRRSLSTPRAQTFSCWRSKRPGIPPVSCMPWRVGRVGWGWK
jgi:putative ABC transport system permease protein